MSTAVELLVSRTRGRHFMISKSFYWGGKWALLFDRRGNHIENGLHISCSPTGLCLKAGTRAKYSSGCGILLPLSLLGFMIADNIKCRCMGFTIFALFATKTEASRLAGSLKVLPDLYIEWPHSEKCVAPGLLRGCIYIERSRAHCSNVSLPPGVPYMPYQNDEIIRRGIQTGFGSFPILPRLRKSHDYIDRHGKEQRFPGQAEHRSLYMQCCREEARDTAGKTARRFSAESFQICPHARYVAAVSDELSLS
nr:zeta-carotene desaturase [Ipomoea batatas]